MCISRITAALLIVLTTACGANKKPVAEHPNLDNFGADYECSQIVSEIQTLNNVLGAEERSSNGTVISSAMISVGVLAIYPLVVVGGMVDRFTRGKKLSKKSKVMDGLVGLAQSKNCQPPMYELQQKEGFRPLDVRYLTAKEQTQKFMTPDLDILPKPRYCTRPEDKQARIYEIGLRNLDLNEYLRFYTVGNSSKNIKIKASHLIYGKAKLPKLRITARRGGKKRGLWVERVNSGETRQLNYLPAVPACASDSIITVDYINTWVVVREVK